MEWKGSRIWTQGRRASEGAEQALLEASGRTETAEAIASGQICWFPHLEGKVLVQATVSLNKTEAVKLRVL